MIYSISAAIVGFWSLFEEVSSSIILPLEEENRLLTAFGSTRDAYLDQLRAQRRCKTTTSNNIDFSLYGFS